MVRGERLVMAEFEKFKLWIAAIEALERLASAQERIAAAAEDANKMG